MTNKQKPAVRNPLSFEGEVLGSSRPDAVELVDVVVRPGPWVEKNMPNQKWSKPMVEITLSDGRTVYDHESSRLNHSSWLKEQWTFEKQREAFGPLSNSANCWDLMFKTGLVYVQTVHMPMDDFLLVTSVVPLRLDATDRQVLQAYRNQMQNEVADTSDTVKFSSVRKSKKKAS